MQFILEAKCVPQSSELVEERRGIYTNSVYYVYIIQLKDKSLYIGYSSDLRQRIQYHIKGETIYTHQHHKFFSLLFYAAFQKKDKAIRFEKYLKSSSGFAFRNKHFI